MWSIQRYGQIIIYSGMSSESVNGLVGSTVEEMYKNCHCYKQILDYDIVAYLHRIHSKLSPSQKLPAYLLMHIMTPTGCNEHYKSSTLTL